MQLLALSQVGTAGHPQLAAQQLRESSLSASANKKTRMGTQVWDSMCGRMATFRYEQLHQQQLLNWGLAERGRFASYRGLLNVPSSWMAGWLLRNLGTKSSLFVGCASSSFEALCNAASTKGAHFYLSRPLTMTSEVKQLSMSCKLCTLRCSHATVPQAKLHGLCKSLLTHTHRVATRRLDCSRRQCVWHPPRRTSEFAEQSPGDRQHRYTVDVGQNL